MPSPGLYYFDWQENGERSRIHLRIDPDGNGLLLVNASRILHLNSTAALMAHQVLNNIPSNQAVAEISKRYRITRRSALDDYTQFANQLQQLIRPDGACPIHYLNIEITAPFQSQPLAPYRMDLALTYRCNNDCSHCYNARERNYPELSTEHWTSILDKLWNIGIPHVVFTGGEPTLRHDLPQLIAHAQRNGQITGLNTNGRRLSNSEYLATLVDAGLDHVQITLESHNPSIHDQMVCTLGAWQQTVKGIQYALETPLYVMTNTTMLRDNSPWIAESLHYIAELGVPTVGLNALIYSGRGLSVQSGLSEGELASLLEIARDYTERNNQRLIWYTPTEYCHFDPMQLELGVKGCTAALYNMCIEPNGDVIPCQSYYQSVGNIQQQNWESIWEYELCTSLRARNNLPAKCAHCSLVKECGGGCPLKRLS